jgi:hypothetical protein
MITKELRKYIDMVQGEDPNLLHEMTNVGPKRHG